jgi:hypothetical protein
VLASTWWLPMQPPMTAQHMVHGRGRKKRWQKVWSMCSRESRAGIDLLLWLTIVYQRQQYSPDSTPVAGRRGRGDGHVECDLCDRWHNGCDAGRLTGGTLGLSRCPGAGGHRPGSWPSFGVEHPACRLMVDVGWSWGKAMGRDLRTRSSVCTVMRSVLP